MVWFVLKLLTEVFCLILRGEARVLHPPKIVKTVVFTKISPYMYPKGMCTPH
jgi:hypothetical protein